LSLQSARQLLCGSARTGASASTVGRSMPGLHVHAEATVFDAVTHVGLAFGKMPGESLNDRPPGPAWSYFVGGRARKSFSGFASRSHVFKNIRVRWWPSNPLGRPGRACRKGHITNV
jgi:hypothetical protein